MGIGKVRKRKKINISLPTKLNLPRFRMPRNISRGFSRKAPFGVIRLKRLKEYFFRTCVLAVIILIIFAGWSLFRPGIRIRVDSETVAAFQIPHRSIEILKNYASENGIYFPELFAVFNAENNFFPEKSAVYDLSVIEALYINDFNQIRRRYNSRSLNPYIEMFTNLFDEIETFPIPTGWYEFDSGTMFGDSWGVDHNFQGNRTHMGTAIIDRENIRGRVPVVSMTAGRVEEAGWDRQLGYFVSIRTQNGTYFLYAHLDSLAPGLASGKLVNAGQSIGQMGNSGGGRDGRSFPVHLHLAIAPDVSFTRGRFWINPYPLLRYFENST